MRLVYELLIDFDGTTRSRPDSYGLFVSADLAELEYKRITAKHKALGRHWIESRNVAGLL